MTTGDPQPDGSQGPHVLVDDVAAPVLSDDDRHHLERVLRVRPGEALTVGDGAGRWRTCVLGAEPEPTGETMVVARPAPVGVAFALIKGGRPELVVQKLTELGVDRIVPFSAARSVVRWDDDKVGRNKQRLDRVAREAVMQSRRAWLPEVTALSTFDAVVAAPSAAGTVAMADLGGAKLGRDVSLLLVGPEGGWSDEERSVGLARIGLSTAVLRAETAAIAAGVLLSAQRDHVG